MRNTVLIVLCMFIAFITKAQIARNGHAHNDYMHPRPLFDALENGFISIEIDVFLHNNDLVVSHTATGLDKKKDIEELYLKPIQKIIKENGGHVYKDYKGPVIFMVELKSSAEPGYAKLKEILDKYKDMLAVYDHDSVIKPGPIQILITGNKPYNAVMNDKSCFATIDGDIQAVKDTKYTRVITRYSSPWSLYFTWTGKGPMPQEEKDRLDELVTEVHKRGKQIRFYAIPDKPAVWRMLLNAHVDWINTDKLKEYNHFILNEYNDN
jgi:hypothetical protein